MLKTNAGSLYTGITNNLERRLKRHREGKGAKYLRGFPNFELVYTENAQNRSEALKREAAIKKMTKVAKEKLIEANLVV